MNFKHLNEQEHFLLDADAEENLIYLIFLK